jgi:hypothetical protein
MLRIFLIRWFDRRCGSGGRFTIGDHHTDDTAIRSLKNMEVARFLLPTWSVRFEIRQRAKLADDKNTDYTGAPVSARPDTVRSASAGICSLEADAVS